MRFNWRELDRYEEEVRREEIRHWKRRHREEADARANSAGIILGALTIGVPLCYILKIIFNVMVSDNPSFLNVLLFGTVMGLVWYGRLNREKTANEAEEAEEARRTAYTEEFPHSSSRASGC